jgi:hypothetical protein
MNRMRVISCFSTLFGVLTIVALAQDATTRVPSATVPIQEEKAVMRPKTYGTTQVSYVQIPGNAFQPWNSSQTYSSDEFGAGKRWVTSGSHDLVANVQLPSGAQVVYMELDGDDNNAAAAIYASFIACNYGGNSCVYYPTTGSSVGDDCTINGFICSGIANTGDTNLLITTSFPGDTIVIDNYLGSYTVLVEPHPEDGSTRVAGVILGYILQVSPAPDTATFNDVPTTDFAFQFIEALAASGITGGCQTGPPALYCPDNFVTRRQMGIFIAKALGLQFN